MRNFTDYSKERAERFRRDLFEWGNENYRNLPWRGQEISPYEVLMAEIFLKQTRAATVADLFPEFTARFPSPASLSPASAEDIIDVIRPLGLYNDRAAALKQIGNRVSGGEIPTAEEELRDLPQVGRYVANATLCFGHGQPRPIIDTNVGRIYARVFSQVGIDVISMDELWSFAEEILPKDRALRYNALLLDLGAAVCTSANPNCDECFANQYCEFPKSAGSE